MTISCYLKGLETARWYTRVVHMVLGMARPTKHSKTGVYYLRKRVPRDLVPVVGSAFVKQSLGTKDPAEAKIAHRAKEALLDVRWTELRRGCQTLDDRQVAALAGEVYARLRDDLPPGFRGMPVMHRFGWLRWSCEIALGEERHPDPNWSGFEHPTWERVEPLVGVQVNDVLGRHGLIVDENTYRRLLVAAARATLLAVKQTLEECDDNWQPDPNPSRYPVFVGPSPTAPSRTAAVSLDIESFWAKASVGYKSATTKRWRPILDRLVASAQVSDMAAITTAHLEEWRDSTLAAGTVSPRSFKRNDLAAIKTMFSVLVGLKDLPANPAIGVTVGAARKSAARDMRGFHEEEAVAILTASLGVPPKRLSSHLAAARRWVPWICAYTGARVNEITQTRASDIKKVDGTWCIHITPEAGTQKSGSKRDVPLHEHLIDQGLVAFAQAKAGDRRLFTAEEDGAGTTRAAEITGGKLATWVRKLGIDDLDVWPNHGWRHRFKTDARPLMQEMYIDAIQGHAPKGQSRKYGDFPARQLAVEIAKMPRQKVEAPLARAVPPPLLAERRKAKRLKLPANVLP